MLQTGEALLLQIVASVVTNWGIYHKLWQSLLQNSAAITIWDKMYYKLGQLLQITTIITNWGITLLVFAFMLLGLRACSCAATIKASIVLFKHPFLSHPHRSLFALPIVW